jgi:hypothetical protein
MTATVYALKKLFEKIYLRKCAIITERSIITTLNYFNNISGVRKRPQAYTCVVAMLYLVNSIELERFISISTDVISGNSSKVHLSTQLWAFIEETSKPLTNQRTKPRLSVSLSNKPINSVTKHSTNSLTYQKYNELMNQPNNQLI